MNNTIELGAIAILVGVTIWVFMRMTRSSKKKPKDTIATRQDRAVWAWARVINTSQGTPGLGGMVRVTMDLEVHLPGTPPYPVSTTWLVEQDALGYVETGKEVPLKVDPQAPEFIFPNGSWAHLAGQK